MLDEFICPACRLPPGEVRMPHGVFWACSRCGGRALSVELLRRTFTGDSVNFFWSRVIAHLGAPGRDCPCCGRSMTEVALADTPDSARIDVCQLCHFVWFDADEISVLTPRDPNAAPNPGSSAGDRPFGNRAAGARGGRTRSGWRPARCLVEKSRARAGLLDSWIAADWRGPKNGCHVAAPVYFASPTFPTRRPHCPPDPVWDRISE